MAYTFQTAAEISGIQEGFNLTTNMHHTDISQVNSLTCRHVALFFMLTNGEVTMGSVLYERSCFVATSLGLSVVVEQQQHYLQQGETHCNSQQAVNNQY